MFEFFKQRPAVVPQIYGYKMPGVPSHNGFIKVGYTGRPDVNIRIGEQVGTKCSLLYIKLLSY